MKLNQLLLFPVGLALAALVCLTALTAAAAPAAPAPFNECGTQLCNCPANSFVLSNPNIDDYLERRGYFLSVGKNGCCEGLPQCPTAQCRWFLTYSAQGKPGTQLIWVWRFNGESTSDAISAGQYLADGSDTAFSVEVNRACTESVIYELWAVNPNVSPTPQVMDTFFFSCAQCQALP